MRNWNLHEYAQTIPVAIAQIKTPVAKTPFGEIELYGLKRAQVRDKLQPIQTQLSFYNQLMNTYMNSAQTPLMQFEAFRYRLPSQVIPIVQTNPLGDMFQGALGGGLGFLDVMSKFV